MGSGSVTVTLLAAAQRASRSMSRFCRAGVPGSTTGMNQSRQVREVNDRHGKRY
ncbi:hypothetical protein BJ970_003605 [Saccharopolyspora phatthalungensis]|uniref:Uncharacterized protein n=1 Tax=Saccharopolyspora phatthalungensis TaxID=664693 RepID=A0A840Q8K4_9PSEU|nr:hypothetical protein [Saccharopolyspora phatthalungensis]